MVDDSIERVRAWLRRRGNTKALLAERAGVHENSLAKVDDPDWNPTAETLRKLEAGIAAIEAEDQAA